MSDILTNSNLLSDTETEINTKSKKTSSILYVDDEESNLRIFKSSFRRHYTIFTAISGKEGLEVLENNDIRIYEKLNKNSEEIAYLKAKIK